MKHMKFEDLGLTDKEMEDFSIGSTELFNPETPENLKIRKRKKPKKPRLSTI